MSSKRNRLLSVRFLAAIVCFGVTILALVIGAHVKAAELTSRSVFLSSGYAGVTANHLFSFNTQGPSTVGSMSFEYCSNTPIHDLPCTAPAGLSTSGFSVGSQIGLTGFSPSASSTVNHIIVNRAPAVSAATNASISFLNVTNPTAINSTIFVRISLFDGTDATGTRVDRGSVAFVVDNPFDVSAFVPPYMTFCVGQTVSLDCSSASGALLNFGELSTNSTAALTSQFAVATNDGDGYSAYINGQTMTAGNKVIPALATQAASSSGSSQFGINLRANSNPVVGAEPEAGAVASGSVAPTYNSPNLFRFTNGDRVAGSSVSTGFNRYTVSYIVNVSSDQSPGIYATTLTYTAIASF